MNDFARPTGIDMAPGGTHGLAKYGDDKNTLVMFYNRSVEVPSESAKRGRRFATNQIYVTIQHPGEGLNKIDRPATDQDKMRYRESWSRFLQNRTQIPDGTPIDMLFPNHPAVGENLRAYGIYTIEQCAALSAHAIDNIGRGGQEYVNRAQKYLDSADKGAGFTMLQKENDDLKQQVKTMEHQLKTQKEQLDHLFMRINDPIRGSQSPEFVPGFDVQSARIDANHVTSEIGAKAKRGRRPSVSVPVVEPDVDQQFTDPLASYEDKSA